MSRTSPVPELKATAISNATAIATPLITPRSEKRALKVTTGMASHERLATSTPTGEPNRNGDHQLGADPGGEHQVLRPLGLLESRIGDEEQEPDARQRDQRPPAEPGCARDQGEGEDADRQPANRLDALLHIE